MLKPKDKIIDFQAATLQSYVPRKDVFLAFENTFRHSEAVNLFEVPREITHTLEAMLEESAAFANYLRVAEELDVYQPKVLLLKYLFNIISCIEYITISQTVVGRPAIFDKDIARIILEDVSYKEEFTRLAMEIIYERATNSR